MKELIIGIDPGSRNTGYGIVAVEGNIVEHVHHGVIHMRESWSLAERLNTLHLELSQIFRAYPARTAAVEKIFFGKNVDSAFKLGHARGVCLLVAAAHHAGVSEYASRYVKKCITGSGAASKEQVQLMIFSYLRIQPKELAFDATDALSLAVTHARVGGINSRVKRMLEESQ